MSLAGYFKGKKVLITGNTGFKGSWLTLLLSHLGSKISGLSLKNGSQELSMFNNCGISSIVDNQYYADIGDLVAIENIRKEVQPDIIFHLAAQPVTLKGYKDPLNTFTTNGIGTANLLEVVRKSEASCTLIIVTSDKCYRNNEWEWEYRENDVLMGYDPYSASKSVAEIISHSYYHSFFKEKNDVKIATCRAGNVIGGGDWSLFRIVPDCIKAWQKKEAIVIRNPESIRPWNYILDVLIGYLITAYELNHQDINGEPFNFGPHPGHTLTVEDVVNNLWKYWDDKSFEPVRIKRDSGSFHEHKYLKLSSAKANSLLNWHPRTDIFKALEFTFRWYQNFLSNPDHIYDYSMNHIDEFLNINQR